ncbi:MAG: nickel-dependent hydrogenase large subunit [Lachnospiraceae bacterium]|nr:nickel-dependent hydrogenase large subunit [Lachnospiraceae bacterium]
MAKRSVVPFGPQHPVLPEPIHIDLVLEDEKVVEAIPNIGFIHRGLEGLASKRDYKEFTYVVERTCGICSFGHGNGYVHCVENIMDVEVPERAKFLRTIWAEIARMHSHLLWLGLQADQLGFESLFYEIWRIREKVLDLLELTTGGRLIFSVNQIGGCLKDITPDMMKHILEEMDVIEKDLRVVQRTLMSDTSVLSRTKGVGVLTKEQAHDLGACGPFARASGIARDMRKLGYDAYGYLDFEPITSIFGDCFARIDVRIREVFQSIDLIRQAIAKIPGGEIMNPVKGNPKGESIVRIEQPRGEAVYYVHANGTKFIDRYRNRTPTFANLSGLCETLKGANFADVGMMVVTIDPCISCTER